MRSKRISIKNELPELLEAVCTHPECPEFIKDAIWEAFNNQPLTVTYNASWWRAQFDSIDHEAAEMWAERREQLEAGELPEYGKLEVVQGGIQ